jgi:hypothetical protein
MFANATLTNLSAVNMSPVLQNVLVLQQVTKHSVEDAPDYFY